MTPDPQGAVSPAETAVRQYAAVRERLIERRRALGLSMSALARKIGVSPSMISQIERGQSLPSVETLFALAGALGATVDTFFGADFESGAASRTDTAGAGGTTAPGPWSAETVGSAGPSRHYFVRKGERVAINIQGGVRWERLSPESLDDVEFLELIYEPGAQSSEHLYPHPGFELVMVIEGRFEIYVGFERYVLDPGDSIAFASSLPHRYVNPLPQESRAVTTILHEPGTAWSRARPRGKLSSVRMPDDGAP